MPARTDRTWDGGLPALRLVEASDAGARRAALAALTAEVLGLDPSRVVVAHREGRAPRLVRPAGAGLHLSSASRGGLAALAVARAPVGVDVERADPAAAVPWNVLHPDEIARLRRAADPAADFAALWALKEAYLKALGTGLARDPAGFAADPGPPPAIHDPVGPRVLTALVRHPGGPGAVAVALVATEARRVEPGG